MFYQVNISLQKDTTQASFNEQKLTFMYSVTDINFIKAHDRVILDINNSGQCLAQYRRRTTMYHSGTGHASNPYQIPALLVAPAVAL